MAWSKGCSGFDRLVSGTVGANPAWDTAVYPLFLCTILSKVGTALAVTYFLRWVLPTVLRFHCFRSETC
jgi:hypothetical protein